MVSTAEFNAYINRIRGGMAPTARAERFTGPVSIRKRIARARVAASSLRTSSDVKSVTAIIYVRTVNGSNERAHWTVKAKRAGRERDHTRDVLARLQPMPSLPWHVQLCRIGPNTRPMDFDGLTASLKHVRDEVAACAGVDDNDQKQITFEYLPQRRERAYRVEVVIAAR